jgi:16S rRNA (guanine966-N2)-methyltransferase
MNTRPTSEKVKEALFNILRNHMHEADVLDLFAGTGSLGIEALSRGAKSAVFVDINGEAISVIRDNLTHTKLMDKAEVYRTSWDNAISRLQNVRKFDIIFLDPPYGKNFIHRALNSISNSGIIEDNGIIVVERHKTDKLQEVVLNFGMVDERLFGDTVLSFYKKIIDEN